MDQPRPRGGRSRLTALIVLCASMLMIILDGSIVAVALPAIREALGFGAASLAWVVNAYLIAFGGLLLLFGRLGDLVGRRRVFVAGLALFTAASLLCGLAPDAATLVTARFLQGVGAAMASAVSLGMIVMLYPEGRERARALGAVSFVGAAGASIGSVLGGVLTQAAGWNWIFLINLPIGLAALALALRVLPAEAGLGLRAGADAPGALLVTAGLMLCGYMIVETSRAGWGSAHTLGFGALSVLLLAAFVARQATAARPLLPLRVLRSRAVAGANLVQLLLVGGLLAFQFHMALFLQQVLAFDAAGTGLAMLPSALTIGVVSLGVSARLISRYGERAVLLAGLAVLFAALAALLRLTPGAGYATHVLPVLFLLGGFGLASPALTSLGMSGAGKDDAGLVSGLFSTTQQVGGALGVAVLAAASAARTDALLAAGADPVAAVAEGHRLAFGIGAALVLAAFVLSLTVLRARPAAARPGVSDRKEASEPASR